MFRKASVNTFGWDLRGTNLQSGTPFIGRGSPRADLDSPYLYPPSGIFLWIYDFQVDVVLIWNPFGEFKRVRAENVFLT